MGGRCILSGERLPEGTRVTVDSYYGMSFCAEPTKEVHSPEGVTHCCIAKGRLFFN